MTSDRPSLAVRRFVWCAVVAPAVLTTVAVGVQLTLLPQVPEMVAVHWDAGGAANGFAPAWTQPVMTAALGLGIPLLIALATLPGLRRGDRGASYRLMGALATALSALVAVMFTGALAGQVGLADARDAPSVVPVLIAGFAGAVAAGVIAWFVQPAEAPLRVGLNTARPLALAPGERAVWYGSATLGRAAIIVITVACLFVMGAGIVTWIGGEAAVAWVITIVAVLLIALALTTTAFRVRVDERGLTVVSLVGVPRFRVPVDDIAGVAVRDVNPMGEFGGWGMRSAPGRFGVVMRSGAAVDVERRSGRRFVVTVDDDAVTAAALLEALRLRATVRA
jgi:hypothetical protein